MDTSQINDIWKLMNEYKFEIDPAFVRGDMYCFICKSLMINACHSVCGCQYCHKCITEYIGDNNKYCPGNKMKCKEDCLNINEDIIKDSRMNKQIFKSRVLCPNESCHSSIELSQMREHLRVCFSKCPFVTIGCDKGINFEEGIFAHLQQDTLSHTELLVQCIINLRNEVSGMKSKSEKSHVEIDSLKAESRMNVIRMTEENEGLKREFATQKLDLVNQIADLKNQLTEERKENETQKILMEERMMGIEKEIAERKKETNNQRRTTQFYNVDAEKITKYKIMKNERRKMNFFGVTNELYSIIDDDYVWKINELSKKKEGRYLYSESFYSLNYKFRLRIYIARNSLILCCHIMKGDNDDKVQWPMKKSVTMNIINQDTMDTYISEIFKYDTFKYDKCAFDREHINVNGIGIGSVPFSRHSAIRDNPSIIVNDSIIVSCVINDE